MTDTRERFEIRFSPRIRWLLRGLGMSPRRTEVVLSSGELRVRAGALRVEIPTYCIASVTEAKAPWWLAGVHTDFRGRWIVNGAPGRMVRLDLSQPVRAKLARFNVTIRRLDLALADNALFRERLAARL
jgi:hypothetical protein